MANAIFLKIDGVDGTCTEAKHDKWIEIESYSFGGSQASTQAHGSGAGSGRVSFQDFHFTVKAGVESPVLFQYMCQGEHIKSIQVQEQKAGGKGGPVVFVDVKMEDCFVTSYQMSDNSGSPEPNCSYSINFSKATFIYTGQTDKGGVGKPVTGTWDAKKNKTL